MKFGICTDIVNYNLLSELGYDFIELSGYSIYSMSEEEFETTVKIIENGAIPCIGFNDFCREDVPLVGENYNIEKIKSYTKKLLERGNRLGIKQVGLGSPTARRLPNGFSVDVAYQQMKTAVYYICECANSYGIEVLFEGLNKEMCNFIITTKAAVDFIRDMNLSNLKLVLDFYHLEVMCEGDREALIALPFANHVHVCQRDDNQKRSYLRTEWIEKYKKQLLPLIEYKYDNNISIEATCVNFEKEAKESKVVLDKIFA